LFLIKAVNLLKLRVIKVWRNSVSLLPHAYVTVKRICKQGFNITVVLYK